MEPIFEAVLADDPSRITAAAAAKRMDEDLLVAELPHWLYRGDTPLHLAAAGLRTTPPARCSPSAPPSTRSTAAARRRCTTPATPGHCRRRGIRPPNGASSSCWSPPEQRSTSGAETFTFTRSEVGVGRNMPAQHILALAEIPVTGFPDIRYIRGAFGEIGDLPFDAVSVNLPWRPYFDRGEVPA